MSFVFRLILTVNEASALMSRVLAQREPLRYEITGGVDLMLRGEGVGCRRCSSTLTKPSVHLWSVVFCQMDVGWLLHENKTIA